MTVRGAIREWLFSSLSLEDALNRLEHDGYSVKATSDPGSVQSALRLEDFSVEIRRSAMKAFPAYLAFFCLENAVREIVSERLGENIGPDWWDSCATKKTRDKVAARQKAEGIERWHARRGEHPIYYSDFGDLQNLITNNWPEFEDLFPDQNWLKARLGELEALRNIIAHSNLVESRDLDRIKLYLEDWTRQVG